MISLMLSRINKPPQDKVSSLSGDFKEAVYGEINLLIVPQVQFYLV